jgi:hypothetical protein
MSYRENHNNTLRDNMDKAHGCIIIGKGPSLSDFHHPTIDFQWLLMFHDFKLTLIDAPPKAVTQRFLASCRFPCYHMACWSR